MSVSTLGGRPCSLRVDMIDDIEAAGYGRMRNVCVGRDWEGDEADNKSSVYPVCVASRRM